MNSKNIPLVSVIIPVFNTALQLNRCLDSVLNQSLTDFEVICINDGSTDNSLDILNEYAKKDARIKVFSQENKKQGAARNFGLQKASGKYVFFLDSDDFLPVYALKTLVEIALKSAAPVVISEDYFVSSKKEEIPDKVDIKWWVEKNPLPGFLKKRKARSAVWNKLYQTDLLKKYQFIEGIYWEDLPFITVLMAQIKMCAYTRIPCYVYDNMRVNSDCRSACIPAKITSYLVGVQYIKEHLKDNPAFLRVILKKRIPLSIQIMVRRVWKAHKTNPDLVPVLFEQLKKLQAEDAFRWYWLSLKTLVRLAKMKRTMKKR